MTNKNNIDRLIEGNPCDKFRKACLLLLVLIFVVLFLTCILSYLTFNQSKSKYYATTTNGVVVQLHALSEPVVNSPYLLEWASIAIRNAFNMSFIDDSDKINKVKRFFTESGWDSFKVARQQSGLLGNVDSKKMIITAIASDAAIITDQGIRHGRYTWTLQVPMLLAFQTASQQKNGKVIITVNVTRVPVLQDPMGGIEINDIKVQSN